MNKKGFVVDGFMLAIGIMLVVIILFSLIMVMTNTNTAIQADGTLNTQQKNIFGYAFGSGMTSAFDVGLVVGLVIDIFFLLYATYIIGTTPVLFILAIITNAAFLIMLPALENFLINSVYNNDYAAVDAALPMSTWIVNNYAIVFGSIIALTLITLYVRPAAGGEGSA